MPKARHAAVVLLGLLTFGSLLVSGGYAWYFRSAAYCNSCAAQLSATLGLPAEIGGSTPRGRRSRAFQNVKIWLPERRDAAAFCELAVCTLMPTAANPRAYELNLRGGWCEVSTRTWLHQDYRRVLESGLRPVLEPRGPQRVVFNDMDLTFARERFRLKLDDACGFVEFRDPQQGRAVAVCERLNGQKVGTVTLNAEFSPESPRIRLDQVQLTVPELPLAALGLSALAPVGVQSGRFSGRLTYRERRSGRELTLRGQVHDVQLGECTGGLLPQAWHGTLKDAELDELTLVNDRFARLRFRGMIEQVVLGDVLAPWGLGAIGGGLTLHVDAAEASPAGVERFVASGHCGQLSLERLSAALGRGKLSGSAEVQIDDFTIRENRLAALDARIVVTPGADDTPGWIERSLLLEAVRRGKGLELPEILARRLPERIEYTGLGVRLEVRDEMLYVFGTHGTDEKAILTLRLFGRDWPVVAEPPEPIDLRPIFDELRARTAAQVAENLRQFAPQHPWAERILPPFFGAGTPTRPAGRSARDAPVSSSRAAGPAQGD